MERTINYLETLEPAAQKHAVAPYLFNIYTDFIGRLCANDMLPGWQKLIIPTLLADVFDDAACRYFAYQIAGI